MVPHGFAGKDQANKINWRAINLYAFKLTRFAHSNRLFKLFGAIMNRFLVARGLNIMKVRDYVDLVTLFLFVFFATHLLGCFWCFLGRLDYYDTVKTSWVNKDKCGAE